jgi:hypothetical protein
VTTRKKPILPSFERYGRLWQPVKLRKVFWCPECRREIGKGSIAYASRFGSWTNERICAGCVIEMLASGKAKEVF